MGLRNVAATWRMLGSGQSGGGVSALVTTWMRACTAATNDDQMSTVPVFGRARKYSDPGDQQMNAHNGITLS